MDLLGCSTAAQFHEIHGSHDWFPSPGTLLIAQTKPVDEGCMSPDLFAGCWHSSVMCKQQEKQEPGQVTPGLGHACKEKFLLMSSFPQAGLHAYLWAFFKAGAGEKHHLYFECSWPPPDLSSAPLWEWSLDEGEDYLSPFISVIKCKMIRRKTQGFHPREASTGDWELHVGKSVEVRRSPILA